MPVTINASPSNGLVQTADGSGIIKVQSNGVTTNALAWVNFNGTTSPGTINASYNVSSVTKNGTGDYTLNFTNALSDANYAVATTCSVIADQGSAYQFGPYVAVGGTTATAPTTKTTSNLRLLSRREANYDLQNANVAIFGN